MPYTINGVGTHYYGRRNRSTRIGVCRRCGNSAKLDSYDTRGWVVFLYLPIFPLRKKRILDQCAVCSAHFAADPAKFEMSRQLSVSGVREKYRADPSCEHALELHACLLAFHMHEEAAELRQDADVLYPDNVTWLNGLGMQLDEVALHDLATPLFERALEIRGDSPEARIGVARRRMWDSQFDEAQRLMSILLAPGAGALYSLQPVEELAFRLQQAKRHTDALELCEHLLREHPQVGQSHRFREFVRNSERAARRRPSMLPPRQRSLRALFDSRSDAVSPGRRRAAYGVVAMLLLLAGLAAANEYRRRHRIVHVVHDAAIPVTVAVDGGPPQTVQRDDTLVIAEGGHVLRFAGGVEREVAVQLKSSYWSRWTAKPVWIVNPAEVPLAFTRIHYARPPRTPQVQLLVGDAFVHFPHVDYLFQQPPNSMKVGSRGAVVTKTHLSRLEMPAAHVAAYLESVGRTEDSLRYLERKLLQSRDSGPLLQAYSHSTDNAEQGIRGGRFLESQLWTEPLSPEWHRTYWSRAYLDGREELEKEYLRRAEAAPQSADLQYFCGLAASGWESARRFFEQAAELDPALPLPRLSLCLMEMQRGEWAPAWRQLEAALERGLPIDSRTRRTRHLLRIALEQYDEAEREYRERIQSQAEDWHYDAMYLGELLAVRGGDGCDWLRLLPPDPATPITLRKLLPLIEQYMRGDFSYADASELDVATPASNDATSEHIARLKTHGLLAGEPTAAVAAAAAAIADRQKWRQDPHFAWEALALSAELARAGDDELAMRWRSGALRQLHAVGGDWRRAAEILESESPPTDEEAADVSLHPSHKAIFFALLYDRFHERETLRNMARKLNVSRWPPHHTVKRITEE